MNLTQCFCFFLKSGLYYFHDIGKMLEVTYIAILNILNIPTSPKNNIHIFLTCTNPTGLWLSLPILTDHVTKPMAA